MAWEQVNESFEWAQNAGEDLSAKIHYIAKIAADGDIELATAGTDNVFGVIREGAVAGKPVTVQFGGVAKVIAGGTVVAGERVTADGSGKGVATAVAGNKVLGIAAMGALANEVFSVILMPGHVAAS